MVFAQRDTPLPQGLFQFLARFDRVSPLRALHNYNLAVQPESKGLPIVRHQNCVAVRSVDVLPEIGVDGVAAF